MTETTEFDNAALAPALPADARESLRFPLTSTVRVWSDWNGLPRRCAAKGINLSARGIAMELTEPLQLDTTVCLELPNSRMFVTGSVRNCQRHGNGWRVGVELAGPLRTLP